jgi:hypothetical protein
MLPGLAWLLVPLAAGAAVMEEEPANCTGARWAARLTPAGLVMVPDRNNQKHPFPGMVNETSVEIHVVKDDIVTVKGGRRIFEKTWPFFKSGDCCYELFSREDGYGQSQHLRSEGQHRSPLLCRAHTRLTRPRLELEDVGSVYTVGCARRGIHPVLKFFLVALGIIALLGLIFYCGKQALLRKRF